MKDSTAASSVTEGSWYRTMPRNVADEILASGEWHPERNTNSKYGCAVYLSRFAWEPNAEAMLGCQIVAEPSEILSVFKHSGGQGSEAKDLRMYIQEQCEVKGCTGEAGSGRNNQAIRHLFLGQKFKAICFYEYAHDLVLVVYDESIIVNPATVPLDSIQPASSSDWFSGLAINLKGQNEPIDVENTDAE